MSYHPTTKLGKRGKRGFTLIELIVVIAIIVILAAVLVPVAQMLLMGRSLRMARNTIDGYLGGVRLEAVNRGKPILLAILPPKTDDEGDSELWPIKVASPEGSDRIEELGEGIVAFMLEGYDPHTGGDRNQAWHRVRYLGRNLIFESKFRGGVTVHPKKLEEWAGAGSRLPTSLRIDYAALDSIQLPKNSFLIYVREDGVAMIPQDRPGFIVDQGRAARLDADLVLTDSRSTAFLDISPVLRVRGVLVDNEELEANPMYGSK